MDSVTVKIRTSPTASDLKSLHLSAFNLRWSITDLCSVFSFTIPAELPSFVGDYCLVEMNGLPVVEGYMEVISSSSSATTGTVIQVEGRDKLCDLVDSEIAAQSLVPSFPVGTNLITALNAIIACAYAGGTELPPNVIAEPAVLALSLTKNEDPEPGETYFSFASRLTSGLNLLLRKTGPYMIGTKGSDLWVTRDARHFSPYQDNGTLLLEPNIAYGAGERSILRPTVEAKSARLIRSSADAFGRYYAAISSALTTAAAFNPPLATAAKADTSKLLPPVFGGGRQNRTKLMKFTGTEADAATHQAYAASVEAKNAWSYSCVIPGWEASVKFPGVSLPIIWSPGMKVRVRDSIHGLDESVIIEEVEFSMDAQSGYEAKITCMKADALSALFSPADVIKHKAEEADNFLNNLGEMTKQNAGIK